MLQESKFMVDRLSLSSFTLQSVMPLSFLMYSLFLSPFAYPSFLHLSSHRSKADAHQEALKKKKKETDPTAISLAEFLEPIKPKSEPAPREVPAIDEDDVAGPFFAEEANAFLGIEPEEKEKEEETSAIKKKTIKRMKETKKASSSSSSTTTTSTSSSGPTSAKNVLPGRRSGFKGVASESAAKLLEDGF